MLPALLVLGVAFALAYGPLTIAATDGVDEHEQGLAGGLLTTSFQFGAALGLAVVTAVVVTASGDGPLSYDALRAGLLVALAAAVLGVAGDCARSADPRTRHDLRAPNRLQPGPPASASIKDHWRAALEQQGQ